MSFVLMVVGILATALGAILIGFGIPINEFSLGNTLILAGTVTAAAGVVIFALSRVVSQLGRVADAINQRPVAASMSYDMGQGDLGRAPAPRPASPARAPEPRLQEPEFEPAAPAAPTVRSSTMVVEEQEVSLSPRAPVRPAEPATAAAGAASGWRPPRPSVTAAPARKSEAQRQPAAQGTSDNPFEAAWPDGRKAAATRREPMLEPAAASAVETPKPEPVSVLKSGVVDGMAYTLYTDGSIEAELAQGVVRFGSIEELRNHLEKSA